jgi:Ca2+-transporting ATPase
MVVLLLIAGGTYVALGDRIDATIVLAAIAPIALVTIVLEARSERALDRLKSLTAPVVQVWRDAALRTIPAEEVVPGDTLLVQEGDIVAADGMLTSGTQLMTDESTLTGESQPVEKTAQSGDAHVNTLLAGTTILSGRGSMRVQATGAATQYGRIGTLVATLKQSPTPLERAIRRLVLQLGALALLFCLGVALMEWWHGAGWAAAIIAGVSLAIAAIPEEFPMVYTLYLSLGAWRLTRGKALVRRLASVETLGSVTVICADKTGTLTLGQMELAGGTTADGETFRVGDPLSASAHTLIAAAVSACEPTPFDPLEQAILRMANGARIDVEAIHSGTLVRDYPFDAAQKYMSHVWRGGDGNTYIAAKGALEGVLAKCGADAAAAQAANERMASQGVRVIAVATGTLPDGSVNRGADESHLRFVGLLGFSDPLRPGVSEALEQCRQAGVRVVMITGDHPVTAHAVADSLGLPHEHGHHMATGDDIDRLDDAAFSQLVRTVAIFARTRPEQKYRIVRALRAQGEVVAMTGDGINDAPALREADIGVALAQRGTEVAREAATLVLLDDDFGTIVNAIRQGRQIYDNLQKAFSYLIAFHVPLLSTALIIPFLGAPLLLLPVHLIWLELIVHPTASLVFEADPPAANVMRRPPRPPAQGFLEGMRPFRPLAEGGVLTAGVLLLYLTRLRSGAPVEGARALALAAMILGQVGLVLAERSPVQPLWSGAVRPSRTLIFVTGMTIVTLLLALYVAPVAALLHLRPPSVGDWGLALIVAAVATVWTEPVKLWRRRQIRPDGS